MHKNKNKTPLVNKRAAALYISVSGRTIDNWMRDGIIPYRKIRKTVRFNLAEIDEALRSFIVPAKNKD